MMFCGEALQATYDVLRRSLAGYLLCSAAFNSVDDEGSGDSSSLV